MLNAVRLLFLWLSFSMLVACSEATPEITDLSSLGGVTATLSSVPNGVSNQTSFYGVVSGSGIIEYRYKYGATSSTVCSDPFGYSSADFIANPPYFDFLMISDVQVTVCVLGGNGTEWQSESNATTVSWLKDTAAPTIVIAILAS